jgi:multidrug resistance efflux pump
VVEATGTINAVTTIQVGSQISGTITKLHADFISRVSKGDLIAEIDPRVYEGQLLQAKADLTNARALLAAAKSNLLNAKAKATQSRADFERTDRLAKDGVISLQQLDCFENSTITKDDRDRDRDRNRYRQLLTVQKPMPIPIPTQTKIPRFSCVTGCALGA